MDKNFQKELLEQLDGGFCDCREILLKYKNLGMTQSDMYKNMEEIRAGFREEGDEESEDSIMDLATHIVRVRVVTRILNTLIDGTPVDRDIFRQGGTVIIRAGHLGIFNAAIREPISTAWVTNRGWIQ